jgi:putative restriction endonuclease
MPGLETSVLRQITINAFGESGATAVCTSGAQRHPKNFFIQSGQISFDVWVYIWTLTYGGWPRSREEYRIQLTGVTAPLETNPRGPTVMIGYEPEYQCFAGFDLRRHTRFSQRSPSIQINVSALTQAQRDGLAFVRKGNREIAVAFRPDQMVAYCLNAEILHTEGAEAKMVSLLSKAATLQPIEDSDLQQVSKERQKLVATISRLSRDSDFRRKVVIAYDRKCAVTGIQLKLVDAAHILPVGAKDSNDEVNNGVCLSPTYHRAFDRGLIYLDESLVMKANEAQEHQLATLNLAGGMREFKRPLGRPIWLPADRRQWPSVAMIERANKFRGIAG